MDPLTAIGLVGNILAFIDFSTKLFKTVKQIHDSSHGTLEENRSRETVVRDMEQLSAKLLTPEVTVLSEGDASLEALARECHEISIQLITLLNKVKSKDPKSISRSFLSALKNKIYEKDREGLEMRLENCRSQLEIQLNFLARRETREKLEQLITTSKNEEVKLEELHRQVSHLRKAVESSSLSLVTQPQLKLLLGTEESILRSVAEERILKRIAFDGMDRREDMVVETHSNTFGWIMEDDETLKTSSETSPIADQVEYGQDNDERQHPHQSLADDGKIRARKKLNSWLAAKDTRDIFHLSGKLGSGKSTLMKHIAGSHRTAERLHQWADGRKLTIASFYFWNAGSEYEKSIRGLYRSLLYRILKDCPELMPNVLPVHFEQAMSTPWVTPRSIKISEPEIVTTLAKIIDSHHLYTRYCFCLFVDGLDEFQTTVKDSYRDLVNLLCRWVANAPGNVRICVSSREYPVFMDSFSPSSRVRLHELTRYDMAIYIQDKLEYASKDHEFGRLVLSILNKANGVFLWVALVVKSLCEGLENGLSCADLTHEVDVLPDELETLYRHIINSLSKSAKRRAYQTFAMIAKLKTYKNYRMSLLAYSFLEEYERDKNFFMNEAGSFSYIGLTDKLGREKSISTRKKLAGWSKGLVELYNGGWKLDNHDENDPEAIASKFKWESWDLALDFTHRSVLEFLDSEDVKLDMDMSLGDSQLNDTISTLLIAHVLFDNATPPYNTYQTIQTMRVLLNMRHDHDLDCAPYTYLERFRSLLGAEQTVRRFHPGQILWQVAGGFKEGMNSIGKLVGYNSIVDDPDREQSTNNTSGNNFDCSRCIACVLDPLYAMVWSGSCDYPLWYISKHVPELSRNPTAISMLACCCIWQGSIWTYSDNKCIRLLADLLERRILSPGMVLDCIPAHTLEEDYAFPSDLTIWGYFLIGMATAYHQRTWFSTQNMDDFLHLFLRWKPDLNVSFSLLTDPEPTENQKFCCYIGNRCYNMTIRLQRIYTGQYLVDAVWEDPHDDLPETPTPMKDYSLREFIKLCAVDNEEHILEMIDEQIGQDEQDGTEPEKIQNVGSSGAQNLVLKESETKSSSKSKALELTDFNSCAATERKQWVVAFLQSAYFRYGLAALIGAIISKLISNIQRYFE